MNPDTRLMSGRRTLAVHQQHGATSTCGRHAICQRGHSASSGSGAPLGHWLLPASPHCRPDEDAISAIAGGLHGGDLNPHVFNYPALFMLAVATVLLTLPSAERLLHKAMPFHFRSLLGQASTTTTNYMVARLLSAAAGISSVWVIFRIALRPSIEPRRLPRRPFWGWRSCTSATRISASRMCP
jgi:hypothetical protein